MSGVSSTWPVLLATKGLSAWKESLSLLNIVS